MNGRWQTKTITSGHRHSSVRIKWIDMTIFDALRSAHKTIWLIIETDFMAIRVQNSNTV